MNTTYLPIIAQEDHWSRCCPQQDDIMWDDDPDAPGCGCEPAEAPEGRASALEDGAVFPYVLLDGRFIVGRDVLHPELFERAGIDMCESACLMGRMFVGEHEVVYVVYAHGGDKASDDRVMTDAIRTWLAHGRPQIT